MKPGEKQDYPRRCASVWLHSPPVAPPPICCLHHPSGQRHPACAVCASPVGVSRNDCRTWLHDRAGCAFDSERTHRTPQLENSAAMCGFRFLTHGRGASFPQKPWRGFALRLPPLWRNYNNRANAFGYVRQRCLSIHIKLKTDNSFMSTTENGKMAKAFSANLTLARHSFVIFFHYVFGLKDGLHREMKRWRTLEMLLCSCGCISCCKLTRIRIEVKSLSKYILS